VPSFRGAWAIYLVITLGRDIIPSSNVTIQVLWLSDENC